MHRPGLLHTHSVIRFAAQHVVGFRHVHLTQSAVNIVMDYASGGSLLELVQRRRRLREPLARWFFQQLVIGVDYCHRKVGGQDEGAWGCKKRRCGGGIERGLISY
jgi:serine/threonine protein kinase